MGHSRTALDPDVEHQQIVCHAIASLDPNTLAAVPDRLSHSDWSGARDQRSHLAELRRLVLLSMETLLGPLSFTLDHSKKSDGDEVGWQTRPYP
jgi:hypothetical protein